MPGRRLFPLRASALSSWCVPLLALVCFALPQAVWAQNTPPKPTSVTVSGGDASVTLGWTSGGDGGSAITKWQYLKKAGDDWDSTWTDICETSSDSDCPSTTSHTVSSLNNGTTYKFKVRAVNTHGDGAESDESASVTPEGKPPKPTNVTVTSGDASVTLGWTSGGDGGSAITKWQYLKEDGGTWDSTWTDICETSSDSDCPSTTSHTVSSLTNGTAYKFKVRAVNTHGDGAESDASASVTPATKPPKPTGVTVSDGDASVTLGWTSGGNGGSAITKWQYLKEDGGTWDSTWTDICETSSDSDCPSTTSHTVSSLTNGTAYKFKVRAVNAKGDGAESDASASVTPATKPPKPTGVTVSGGNASVTLGWTSGGNGGSAITKWQYLKEDGGTWDSTWTDICVTSSDSDCPSTTSHTVSSLTNGTAYKFKVRAVNAKGDGAESDASASVTPATKPPKPTGVTVSGGDASVTLGWTSGGDGGSAITKWQYLKEDGGTWDSTWTDICVTSSDSDCPSTTSHTVSSLTNGTAYKFKVRAVNAKGDGAESDASASVTPATKPPKPTGVTVSGGDASVTLGWTSGGDGGSAITKWQYLKEDGGTWDSTWTDICETSSDSDCPSTTSHTVSSLTNGTAYKFKVRAVNAKGDGAESDASASVTPEGKPPKPTDVTVSSGDASVTLGWTSGGDGGSAITKWQYLKEAGGTWDSTWTDICETSSDSDCPSKTSHAVSNLNNGTAYKFKVRAVNTHGDGAESDESASVVPAGKPPKPAAPTVKAGHRNVIVTSSISSNNGSAITTWRYKKKTGDNWDSEWTDVPNSFNLASMTVTAVGLTNGTKYRFKVQAVNGVGAGDESDESDEATPKIYKFEVTGRTETTATLSLTGYPGPWYYKGGKSGSGTCTAVQAGTTTVALASLTAGTSYTYNAYNATNANCESDNQLGSALTFSTLDFRLESKTNTTANLELDHWPQGEAWSYRKEYPGAGICKDTAATSVSLGELTENTSYTYRAYRGSGCATGNLIGVVHFKTTPAHGIFISGIKATSAKLRLSTAGADIPWWHQKTAGPGAATCVGLTAGNNMVDLSGLTAEGSYTWAAYRRDGCADNHKIDDVTFATKKPSKPAKPTATAGNGQVTLASSVTTNGGPAITKWQYIKKEGGNAWETDWKDISSSADNSLSTTITGLKSNTSYQFKVRAVNSVGESTGSDASTAVTTPAVTLTAGSVTHNTATLTQAKHPGNWWLKRTTPADTNCKSKGTTATESLSSLTGNTSYTYKAYSNSDCSTELATETFLTKPAKPGKPTATAGAGSGKLTLTATLTGGAGALTKWEYTKDDGANWTDITTDTDNSLSHVVTDLTDGTNYTFKVRATNATGTGPASDASTAAAPADEALTAGSVTHNAATLTLANHPGNWWLKRTTPASTTCKSKGTTATESLSSLTGNTSYTYKAYSNSDCSTELATETFLTKPAKPGKPTATAGAGSGKLTLTATLTGGSGALTKWEYTKDDGANWTDITTDTDNNLSHVVTDLTDGTNYTFKVRATNATGTGPVSDASTAVAPADETLTAGSVTHNTATLTIAGYSGNWYYKEASGTCSTDAVSTTSVDLDGLAGNTSYTYSAYGDSGCTSSKLLATASAFLTRPAKPGKPTAIAGAGSGKLTLTATLTGGAGALTKWEYTKDDGANWTDITTDTDNNLSHVVTDLTDGTEYTFKVRATNATGTGPASDASTAVAPQAVTLSAGTATAAGMTLTIGNYSLAWHYKYTTPDGGSCSSTAVSAGTSSKAVTGLDSNTAYTFKAYSDSGCSDELAAASSYATLPPKAAKPTLTVNVGDGRVTLTSSVTGTASVTKWQYKKKKGSGNYDADWTDISSTSKNLSYTVTDLDDDSAYRFQVRARNASGPGEVSDESDAATPRAVTFSAGTATAAGMTLTIDNWSAAWRYKRTAPSVGSCSSEVSAGTSSKAVTGLDSNTAYTFKAYSDRNCSSELAAASSYATLPPKAAKPTPGVNVGDGKVKLTSSVGGGSAPLTKWQYKKKKDSGNYDDDWSDITSTSKTLSYTVTELTDGSAYKFKVRARNASGPGETSDESDAATPQAVTLSAGTATAAGMTLTISNYSVAWYYKHTKPDGGDCSSTPVSAGTSSKSLASLTSNTAYTFAAYSDSGCSDELAAASSYATLPPKPTTPTVAAGVGSGKLTLSSSATSGGDLALTKWQYTTDNGTNWKDISSTSTTLSHTVTGLDDDTSYRFRVRAWNASGESAASDQSQAVAPADETLTVSKDTITATGATLKIGNWSAKWYYKYTSPSNGSCSDQAVPAGTSAKAVTGLDSNTAYTFKAYSDNGCSKELAAATAFPTLPPKPVKPTVTAGVGSGKIELSSSVSGGAVALTKWQYTTDDGSSWKDISNSTSKTLSHTVSGLTDDTDYTFKVRAWNASGAGEKSDASDSATPEDETLTAGTITATGATLTIGNWSAAWHYKYTSPSGGGCSTQAVPAGTPSQAVTGLDSNTAYTFKAYSDSGCSAELAAAAAFPTLPPKPAKPTMAVGNTELTLSSSVSGGSAALTEWQYKRKVGTGNFDSTWTKIGNITSKTLTHAFTGLTNNTDYSYKVRALNASGAGEESDPSQVMAPTDATLEVDNITTTGARLTIIDPPTNLTTWYYKYTSPDDGQCTSASGTTANVTGLEKGTNYTLEVYRDNTCSTSLGLTATFTTLERDAPRVTPTPAGSTPAAPGKPTATGGDRQVTLSWTSSDDGGSAVTEWEYQQKEGSGDWGSWIDVCATASDTDCPSTTSSSVTGLSNGTAYRFRVRAVNAVGAGAASPESDPVTPAAAPPAPDKPTVAAGDGQVTLSWASNGDGGSAITEWEYQQKESSGDWGSWIDVCATAGDADCPGKTSWTVTDLTNGTAYRFKVRAVNAAGAGAASPESEAVTPAAAPPAPGKPAAEAGAGQVTLTWTSNGDGGSAITEWEYQQKEGSSDWGDWADVCATASDADCPGKTSWTVTGLTNGTAYRFKVRAVNAVGAGAASPESEAVTPAAAPPAPGKPAVTAGDGQVTLTWHSNGNGGAAITKWQYVKKAGDDVFETTWTDIPGSTERTTTWTVTGLANGTAYRFRVRAVNAVGQGAASPQSEPAAPLDASPPAPSPPAAPSAPAVSGGDQSVTLAWTAGDNGGSAVTKWQYVKKAGDDAFETLWTDIPGSGERTTTWTVTGLANGTAYRFRVRAVNVAGAGAASPESDPVTPATVPPAPDKPAVAAGDGQVTLTWRSNGNGGAAITKWQYVRKVGDNAFETLWTDIPDSTERTTTWTVTGLANGTAYRFRVRAVNANGAGTASPESEAVTPAAAPPGPALRAAVKRTLAAVARRSLSSALDQIGARFAASVPPSGLTLAGRAVTRDGSALAAAGDGACPAGGLSRHGSGERLGLAAFGSGGEGCGGWRSRAVTGDELLGGSGFSWLLGAAPGEPGADPSAPLWSVWGRGDLGTFEGRPSGSRYRGELRTGWLGMDARAGPWVAGFAVSHGTGGADYHSDADVDADAAGGGAEEQGRLETVLTALYPYARWTFPDGLELRGVLGAGTGETRHWPGDGAAREKSGLRMYMASLGARRSLPAAAGLDLAARGDASLSRLETGAGPDHIDGLSADNWRARLGLEASRRVDLGGDAALTPFVETAVRRDGGDGLTGTGVEVAGGVRYAAPGVQVEARGRWLAAHTEAGARERGVSVTARMGPGAHGRGLSLALSPRWGAGAGGGAQTLWRDELPGSGDSGGDSGGDDEAAIDARIGYGVSLAPRGLLTPFAEAGLAGGDDRRLRLGTRFEAARLDLGVELSGARRESAGGTEHALKLDLDLRF